MYNDLVKPNIILIFELLIKQTNIMATYGTPDEVKTPKVDWANQDHDWDTGLYPDEQRYVDELKAYCRLDNEKPYIGDIVKFPAGDGHAQYMVANLSPVELIHLEVGDAWESETAEYITAKGIKEKIASEKAMQKLFSAKVQQ